jgi:hypothetical protein
MLKAQLNSPLQTTYAKTVQKQKVKENLKFI